MSKEDKHLPLPEFFEDLKKGLKERLEAFQQECLELRKKENEALAKSEKLKKDMVGVGSEGGDPGQMMLSEPEADDPLCSKCNKLKKMCKCSDGMYKDESLYNFIQTKAAPSAKLPGDKKPSDSDGEDAGSSGEPEKLKKASAIPGAPKAPGAPKSAGVSNPGGTPAGAVKNVNPMSKGVKLPGQKDSLPSMEGFKSIAQNPTSGLKASKPALPDLSGFQSLASNPTSGLHGGGKLEGPKLPGKK